MTCRPAGAARRSSPQFYDSSSDKRLNHDDDLPIGQPGVDLSFVTLIGVSGGAYFCVLASGKSLISRPRWFLVSSF